MDNKTKILGIIRIRGPVSPTQMARELRVESYLASAMLSELVSSKELRISSLKVGSSPVYYLPEQRPNLEQFVGNLNEKDRRTFYLLKEKKILKDSDQEPLIRVSLRNIKDFAVPLEVSHDGKTEVFWRWHTLPAKDTEDLVKDLLGMKEKEVEKKPELRPVQKLEKKVKTKPLEERSEFLKKVNDYFKRYEINVIQEQVLKKNMVEYVIKLPSAVGELLYFCNAIDKKKLSEGDLAGAYVKGENKKLPVLIITTGDLTKSAKDSLEKDFKKLTVKKI
jgi:hypothetical protein